MPIGQLGMMGLGVASNAIGMGMQNMQQEKMQARQIAGQKEMTDYNVEKQKEMLEATNAKAQVNWLKDAGLSVGLMYGGKGGGGQTSNISSGSVNGGIAQAPDLMKSSGMGLSNELIKAQIEATKAQANKTNVEAAKIGGVDTDLGNAQVSNLMQGINESGARQKMLEVESILKGMDVEIKGATIDEQISNIVSSAKQAVEVANSMEMSNNITEATIDDKIKIIKQEAIGSVIANALANAQVANTKQGTMESKQRVAASIKGLIQKDIELSIAKQNADSQSKNADTNRKGLYIDMDKLSENIRHNKELESMMGERLDIDWERLLKDEILGGINAISDLIPSKRISKTVYDGEHGSGESTTTTTQNRK